MSGYELLLRRGGREEVVVTDRCLRVGEQVELAGEVWLVEAAMPPQDQFCERRFILVPPPVAEPS